MPRAVCVSMPFGFRNEFWARGSRFVICHRNEAAKLNGQVLSSFAAESVLSRALAQFGGDDAELRSIYGRLNSSFDLRSVSNAQVLKWFSRELGDDVFNSTSSPLVIVQLGHRALRPLSSNAPTQPAASESERIVRALDAQLIDKDLVHQGRSYRLVAVADQSHLQDRDSYEIIGPNESQALLHSMVKDAAHSAATRDLLQRAIALLAPRQAHVAKEALALLRRVRHVIYSEGEAAPIRSRVQKARELDWITIQFVDDSGQPIANQAYELTFADGSKHRGKLDENGLGHTSAVPAGTCLVSFPDFEPTVVA